MPAFYSLVQYVPDLVGHERVNIGVVVFTEAYAGVHFIENWTRIRQFGGNVSSLQAVARQIEKLPLEALQERMASWDQSIQFTKPAASLLDPDALLIDVAGRCLIDPAFYERDYRNRQQAVALTKQSLAAALESAIGKAAKKLLKPHFQTTGRLDKHEYDLAVVNGQPFLAVNSLSFETPEEKEITKVVQATAWTIDDVKQRDPDFPLAVVALPPRRPLEVYDRAVNTFTKLGAEVVHENELASWSKRIAARVQAGLGAKP
jgi:hypothetical protein